MMCIVLNSKHNSVLTHTIVVSRAELADGTTDSLFGESNPISTSKLWLVDTLLSGCADGGVTVRWDGNSITTLEPGPIKTARLCVA